MWERKENVKSTFLPHDDDDDVRFSGNSGKENLKNVHRPQLRATVDDSFLLSPKHYRDDVEFI
jgi:hypothetical protein